jgi:hypothetical protein
MTEYESCAITQQLEKGSCCLFDFLFIGALSVRPEFINSRPPSYCRIRSMKVKRSKNRVRLKKIEQNELHRKKTLAQHEQITATHIDGTVECAVISSRLFPGFFIPFQYGFIAVRLRLSQYREQLRWSHSELAEKIAIPSTFVEGFPPCQSVMFNAPYTV